MSDSYPRIEVASRAELRDWLEQHHDDCPGIWLVTRKAGRPGHVPYPEVVEEALCVGWVDGQARRVDDDRTSQLLTPRRPRSGWARTNKERVTRLRLAGLMRPAGEAAITRAQENGSWTLLDDVEDLVEPPDLRAALDASPEARRTWDGFPPSARRAMLSWLVSARTTPTRDKRISLMVAEAAEGRRAYPAPRGSSS